MKMNIEKENKKTKETIIKKVNDLEEAVDLERQKMFYLSNSNEAALREFRQTIHKIKESETRVNQLKSDMDEMEIEVWKRLEIVKKQ